MSYSNYTYAYIPNIPKRKKSIGISLGWNCGPAGWGVDYGFRETKANGYKTGPFDEMVSNVPGVIECIKDDFKYFMADEFLELKKVKRPFAPTSEEVIEDTLIYNTKYNFYFNHESPGHGDLYIHQQWVGGINHYIDNNFHLLKERYNRRVNAFKSYIQQGLTDGTEIIFIVFRINKNIQILDTMLKEKYPTLNYGIVVKNPPEPTSFVYKQHILMGMTEETSKIEINEL
jgi:hypothetical protein